MKISTKRCCIYTKSWIGIGNILWYTGDVAQMHHLQKNGGIWVHKKQNVKRYIYKYLIKCANLIWLTQENPNEWGNWVHKNIKMSRKYIQILYYP